LYTFGLSIFYYFRHPPLFGVNSVKLFVKHFSLDNADPIAILQSSLTQFSMQLLSKLLKAEIGRVLISNNQ